MPEEESAVERGEVGKEPAWNAAAAPVHETVVTTEPKTAELPPVQESVPFETERRAYGDRRRPTNEKWVGTERRSGKDRRDLARATTEPTQELPIPTKATPEDEIVGSHGKAADIWNWSLDELRDAMSALRDVMNLFRLPRSFRKAGTRVEMIKLSAWVLAVFVLPGLAFYHYGFQASLIIWFVVTAAFFVALFFHLNRK